MELTRSITTLEYSISTRINSRTLDQRYVALFSRFIFFFVVSILFFGYQVFHYDRFRECRIDFHAY